MELQFKDFIDPIKASQFFVAVHTPIKLMYYVIVTSYNCYISGLFQSFPNTFIKTHQTVNISIFILKAKMSSHNLNYVIVT